LLLLLLQPFFFYMFGVICFSLFIFVL
jgi:hypothetical protein